MKTAIVIAIAVLYTTGILQFAIFGDFTARLGHTFNKAEDDRYWDGWYEARWKVVHAIDSL